MKSIQNKLVRFQQTTTSLNLENLLNVNANTAVNGQVLAFNNGNWVNQSLGVSTVFGRAGNVVAQEGDYSLGQLGDVVINAPSNNQVLSYGTGGWQNRAFSGYKNAQELNSGQVNFPLQADTFYLVSAPSSLLMYFTYTLNERVFIQHANNGTQISINFPAGGFVNGVASPLVINNASGCIEFISKGQLSWEIGVMSGNWAINGNLIVPWSSYIQYSLDSVISNPLNNQAIIYNGTKWQNQNIVNSFNSRVGSVVPQSGDYLINQIGGSSFLADSNNISLTSPIGQQRLVYDSSLGKWKNSFDLVVNSYNGATVNVNSGDGDKIYKFGNLGGNLIINPLNVGEKIMVISDAGTFINFTGTSFVTNSQLGGGTSNPTFSINFCVVELQCVFSGAQTYYNILRIIHTRNESFCTLNGIKLSAISKINDIPDINITTPSNGDLLGYNGSNWINKKNFNYFKFNSDGNLANNQYQYVGHGQNAAEQRAQMLLPFNIKITQINIRLFTAPGLGNSRTYTVRLDGANTVATITISDTNLSATANFSLNANAGQLFSFLHTSVGATNSIGLANIIYENLF